MICPECGGRKVVPSPLGEELLAFVSRHLQTDGYQGVMRRRNYA